MIVHTDYTVYRYVMVDTKLNKSTRLSERTQNRLKKYVRFKDETYDHIINRIIDSYQLLGRKREKGQP
jgi:hypothetical protein